MRFKIPCKKYRLPHFSGHSGKSVRIRTLTLVLAVVSLAVQADAQLHHAAEDERAVFWSIHHGGEPAGHVLGTIHSEDSRVLDFSEDFLGKLRSNKLFAMELVPDLPTLEQLTQHMRYEPGKTLESVVGLERFTALVEALSAYRVPEEFIRRMKPWAAMLTLSTPPPETGFFMDFSLSLRASGSGLKVVGLETLEQQLSFLEDMPLAMQLDLLDQAIAESGTVQQAHDQMLDAYLENDLQNLQTLSNEQLRDVGVEAHAYFTDAGIVARNHRMLESLLPQLEHNSVFVAVGALHLPGEEGLLNLLRRHGYELIPLEMPFIDAENVPAR